VLFNIGERVFFCQGSNFPARSRSDSGGTETFSKEPDHLFRRDFLEAANHPVRSVLAKGSRFLPAMASSAKAA
jgi:hypothetical protein